MNGWRKRHVLTDTGNLNSRKSKKISIGYLNQVGPSHGTLKADKESE